MDDQTVRAALQRHWDAFDANDFQASTTSTTTMMRFIIRILNAGLVRAGRSRGEDS